MVLSGSPAIKDINAAEKFDPTDDRVIYKIVTPLASHTIVLDQGVSQRRNLPRIRQSLENYPELFDKLINPNGAIKVLRSGPG